MEEQEGEGQAGGMGRTEGGGGRLDMSGSASHSGETHVQTEKTIINNYNHAVEGGGKAGGSDGFIKTGVQEECGEGGGGGGHALEGGGSEGNVWGERNNDKGSCKGKFNGNIVTDINGAGISRTYANKDELASAVVDCILGVSEGSRIGVSAGSMIGVSAGSRRPLNAAEHAKDLELGLLREWWVKQIAKVFKGRLDPFKIKRLKAEVCVCVCVCVCVRARTRVLAA